MRYAANKHNIIKKLQRSASTEPAGSSIASPNSSHSPIHIPLLTDPPGPNRVCQSLHKPTCRLVDCTEFVLATAIAWVLNTERQRKWEKMLRDEETRNLMTKLEQRHCNVMRFLNSALCLVPTSFNTNSNQPSYLQTVDCSFVQQLSA